jgi:hypothetical protein
MFEGDWFAIGLLSGVCSILFVSFLCDLTVIRRVKIAEQSSAFMEETWKTLPREVEEW